MESEYFKDTSRFYLHIFRREDAINNPYWDQYIWDCMLYPEYYHRFVIQDDFLMPIGDEELFAKYTTNIKQVGVWKRSEIEVLLKVLNSGVGLDNINENQVGRDNDKIYD